MLQYRRVSVFILVPLDLPVTNDLSGGRGSFGDPRRPHHYGHSDRRGIISKSSKAFTREQLSEMLEKLNEKSSELSEVPLLSTTSSSSSSSSDEPTVSSNHDDDHHLPSLEDVKRLLSVHSEVELMFEHMQTLARAPETAPGELVAALDELEYHVHQIDNARDLDTIGGLRMVVLLLNHTDSDVAAAAAHVLGSAAQG